MKKILVVGLGNVGPQYDGTRHNLGITAVRAWVEHLRSQPEFEVSQWQESKSGLYAESRASSLEFRVSCIFPLTMMNESGRAVAAYLQNNPIASEDVIVVYDDMEVSLGEVTITVGGSAKGHNGVRSIHDHLGTQEITRVRLGVGRPPGGQTANDFVLGVFTPDEQPVIEQVIAHAGDKISQLVQQKMSP